ncbi:MAG: glycosyltransferase [Sandaracinaceae bacterium]
MSALHLHVPEGGLTTVSGLLVLSGSVPRGAMAIELNVDGVGRVPTRCAPLVTEPPPPSPEPGWEAFHAAFVAPRVAALSIEVTVTREMGVEVIEPDLIPLRHREERITARLPLPDSDVLGALDEPGPNARFEGEDCLVSGWVGATGRRVVRVWAEAGGERAFLVRGGARPDVAYSFPDVQDGDRSGFSGTLRLPGGRSAAGTLQLELFAELDDGSRCRWLRRSVRRPVPPPPVESANKKRRWWDRWVADTREPDVPPPPPARAPLSDRAQRDHDHARSRLAFPESPGWRRELRASAEGTAPAITFLLRLSRARVDHARALLDSLRAQTDPRWRLLATDDGSSGPYLAGHLAADERIERVPFEGGAMEALSALLDAADTAHVALLEPGITLAPDALSHIAARLARCPSIDLLTTDEDHRDPAGRPHTPVRRPPPNRALQLGAPQFGRLTVFRKSAALAVGGFDPRHEGAHAEDLCLRMIEGGATQSHLSVVAAHLRASRPPNPVLTSCLEAALERQGIEAALVPLDTPGAHRVVWSEGAIKARGVTVLIPTRDRVDLLRPCVDALRRTVPADQLNVLIVDDHSVESRTHVYLRELAADPLFEVVRDERQARTGFNFARLVNFGVAHVKTPSVLLLNNDTVPTRVGWLAQMAGWLARPDVGAVGARLLYPDGRVQHAGVTIGVHGGLADHLLHGTAGDDDGYLGLGRLARDTAAVTGACLLTHVALYREMDGLDETRFGVDYNDIDYCLRLQGVGKRVVYAPEAELVHHGSASRGGVVNPSEKTHFIERHAAFRDPFVNPAFDVESSALRLDPHHFDAIELVRSRRLSVRLATSAPPGDTSSEFEDLLAALVRHPAVDVRLDPFRAWPMGDAGRALRARVREEEAGPADVFIAHGPHAYHAVERARQLGCASVLHVTERADFEDMAGALGPPHVALDLYRRAVSDATRVLFASPHIRETYRHLALRDHFRVFAPGIALGRLRAFCARHPRERVRERAGVPPGATVVLLAGPDGTLPPAQEAAEALGAIVYRVDGSVARPACAAHPVLDRLAALSMGDVLLMTEGPAVFPRSLLEAMAFGLTVIGPRAPGIGDVIGPDVHGFMVDVRSRSALQRALSRSLADPSMMRRVGDHAAVQVRLLMSCEHRIERYVELLHEARVAAL